ncbi:hypothetical protein [Streptomyces sp. Da 82-17]|uniref:hypothetical protein n=1 Tax=Streptomyces sp. Da 82-17 TaxID=3377116 RepID=UPI0038D4C0A9
MLGIRLALRLLEGACAVVVVLGMVYAVIALWLAHHVALVVTYRRGGLTLPIIVFVGACVGWLLLRLIRSRWGSPAALCVIGASSAGLVALTWWALPPPPAEPRIPQPPSRERFHPPPPDSAFGPPSRLRAST